MCVALKKAEARNVCRVAAASVFRSLPEYHHLTCSLLRRRVAFLCFGFSLCAWFPLSFSLSPCRLPPLFFWFQLVHASTIHFRRSKRTGETAQGAISGDQETVRHPQPQDTRLSPALFA